MQTQNTAASNAGSQRLEAADSSLDKDNQGWATAQSPAPQLPIERPASHPYLEPQLHGQPPNHPTGQQNHQSRASFGLPMQQSNQHHNQPSDQQSAIATLNAQLSSMGIELPESKRDQTQEHLLRGAIPTNNLASNVYPLEYFQAQSEIKPRLSKLLGKADVTPIAGRRLSE